MNKKIGILGLAIVGVLLTSGLGLALADGAGPMNQMANSDEKVPNGKDQDYERPMDGSNSPWITEDERLEMFQDRYNLTDTQIEDIRIEVTSMIEEGVDRTEIRDTVLSKLQEFGVESPGEMGIGLGSQRSGERKGSVNGEQINGEQRGQGYGQGMQGQGKGNGQGKGMGNCPYTESE